MEVLLLIFSVIILGYWYWKNARASRQLPPGPIGFPILGYLPSMDKNQHIAFSKLKSKYGDIFSFFIGQRLFVVLSSYEVIKEALTKHGYNFAARPVTASLILPESPDIKGIGMNSGKLFIEIKQIVLSNMKSFTRSNAVGEFIISNEIQYLCAEIDQSRGQPTDIGQFIVYSVINVIWFWLFNERKAKDDAQFTTIFQLIRNCSEAFQSAGIEFAFPKLFSIPFIRKFFQASTVIHCYRRVNKLLNDKISEIESSPKTESDFSFVQEWLKLYPKGSDHYDFYRKQLPTIVKDLILGGMETTAVTLQWGILYVMEYPDIQQKVQAEIVEVVGKFNKPTLEDKSKLPFTTATILEIHRMASIGPIGLPYQSTKTTTINDYTIPENSIILANLWEVHHDPKIFPNPEKFHPERFLENGEVKKVEELIPFSIGKRQCIGKSLGQMELFLFFTSLLQRYTFKKPPGVKLDFSYDFSFIVSPRPYQVLAIPN